MKKKGGNENKKGKKKENTRSLITVDAYRVGLDRPTVGLEIDRYENLN